MKLHRSSALVFVAFFREPLRFSSDFGRKYNMLMTVLRGDLAIRQSKILIRLFKTMKDFIIEREDLIGYNDVAKLAIQTSQN